MKLIKKRLKQNEEKMLWQNGQSQFHGKQASVKIGHLRMDMKSRHLSILDPKVSKKINGK
jgi:hypothetical protein